MDRGGKRQTGRSRGDRRDRRGNYFQQLVSGRIHREVPLTLLQHYVASEKLCGKNRFHSAWRGGLCDADRWLLQLSPPPYLVVSLVWLVTAWPGAGPPMERRTGVRRKTLL